MLHVAKHRCSVHVKMEPPLQDLQAMGLLEETVCHISPIQVFCIALAHHLCQAVLFARHARFYRRTSHLKMHMILEFVL